jgi:hypothetical protein
MFRHHGFRFYRNADDGAGGAPAPTPSPSPSPTPSPTPTDFAVPDTYKEKGWSKNLKSQDDVWKMLDNAQTLAGKKTVVPDWDKATPAEIEEYVGNLRPKDKSAYQFDDTIPEEERGAVADILHKAGIPAYQAKQLITGLMGHVTGMSEKMYDKDEFLGIMKTSFGDGFEKTAGSTAKVIASHLNKEDKALLEQVPNQFLGLIYRMSANMAKAYGAKEIGAGGETNPGGGSGGDKTEERKKIRDEIKGLTSRPHTVEEKMALQNKLNATYK